ncbi:DUF3861 domain-containing protein [Thiofilum flexile]|uniref:DUF3861 domain-containing protein n=1 Tax=Thiofilum flexile TaxID=125627 RepID=UPI000375D446|nr:DUF3861 domain-containing protein [Thiofilum flexile]
MKGHLYQVTVEKLADNQGNPVSAEKLVFEARNHDDLATLVSKVKQRGQFEEDEATAFIVGLKLFSEVMLRHKDMELFKDFAPHFKEFMGKLKSGA